MPNKYFNRCEEEQGGDHNSCEHGGHMCSCACHTPLTREEVFLLHLMVEEYKAERLS